ncbi:aKG-HExxH-type peptide beta-hydroxylase [Bacillus thuringiensis]|uniref:aKG-HExxH-type peptide beta-hydroxylase n=1 Tax=Bacillus thuringiensis TaxID=1428 RepID=UPI00159BAE40|nr:HEXXH motif-containing putative peptide modification protein [Bacillus thuringiensis]
MSNLPKGFLNTVNSYDTGISNYIYETKVKALIKVGDILDGKISSEMLSVFKKMVDRIKKLPVDLQQRILLDSHFEYWWLEIMNLYKKNNIASLEKWLEHGGNFGVIENLLCGSSESFEVNLTNNEIRFPGQLFYIVLNDEIESNRSANFISCRENILIIKNSKRTISIPLEKILNKIEHINVGYLKNIDDSDTIIDANHPFIEHQLNNIRSRDKEANIYGVQEVTVEAQKHISESLEILESVWRGFKAEFNSHVSLVIPFTANGIDAFTNSKWPKAIFISNNYSNIPYTIERIVHETSHLRLNRINIKDRLHLHDDSYTVPSPFRKGPRPVIGLIHGIYVFTRVAHAMSKIFKETGEKIYIDRIAFIIKQVTEAIGILEERVKVTPLCRDMIKEMKNEIDSLEVLVLNENPNPISSKDLSQLFLK